jgi:hypothetical protein
MAASLFPVTVLVDRLTVTGNRWVDHRWQPHSVLPGASDAAPWTALDVTPECTRYVAGMADLALYPREGQTYAHNIESERPAVWVILRRTESAPGVALLKATVCPGEAHALNDSGDDIVEPVAMPDIVRAWVEAYLVEHPPETEFHKRQRDRADPEALAHRGYDDDGF